MSTSQRVGHRSKFILLSLLAAILSYGFVEHQQPQMGIESEPRFTLRPRHTSLTNCGLSSPSVIENLQNCRAVNHHRAHFNAPIVHGSIQDVAWFLVRKSDSIRVWFETEQRQLWAYVDKRFDTYEDAITECSRLEQSVDSVEFHLPSKLEVDQGVSGGVVSIGHLRLPILTREVEGLDQVWSYSPNEKKWRVSQRLQGFRGVYCMGRFMKRHHDDYDRTKLIKRTDLEFQTAFGEFPQLEPGKRTSYRSLK